MEIKRDVYLDRLIKRRDNGMAKVVTGIRRCGKSYLLLRMYVRWLKEQGVPEENILSIQLDDLENIELRDPMKLHKYVIEKTADKDRCYVVLDEIQYVTGFSDVVNSLLHRDNLDVYITGSNSRFLSTDILTEFRGRGDEVRVRPLSFAEFVAAYDGEVSDAWRDYFTFGGMPVIPSLPDDESKTEYLKSLLAKVYLSDICDRNDLRNEEALENTLDILASSTGSLTNPSKIAATFTSRGIRGVSDKTVKRYMDLLLDAFLVERAKRYDIKGRKYIGAVSKYYFSDVGLRNAQLGYRQQEENHIMENVIYNELRFRGWSVDVGVVDTRAVDDEGHRARRQLEIDFVASKGGSRCYVQSAFEIPDGDKEQQEKRPLNSVGDSIRKVVVVKSGLRPWMDERGVLTVGLFDFLLDPDKYMS